MIPAKYNYLFETLLLCLLLLQRKERQEQHAYKLEQDLALCKSLSNMVTMVTSYDICYYRVIQC